MFSNGYGCSEGDCYIWSNTRPHMTLYRSLIAGSAQNNSKNRLLKCWNIIGIFAEYNINSFSKLPKSKKFLFLTRILLTVEAFVNTREERVLLL